MPDEPKKPPITQPSESTEIPGLPQRNSYASAPGPPTGFGSWASNMWASRPIHPQPDASLRQDIASAIEEHKNSSENAVSESPPPQTADNAVRAFILLFVLGFVLRGVDVMDRDMWDAIQKWGIAAVIAAVDYFYVPVRNALGPRFASTAASVGTDFRWWIVAALIILSWAAVFPAIEKHGWPSFASGTQPVANGFTQQQVNEKVASAVANLNLQLTEANRQRDAARREADDLRQKIQNAPPPPPAPEDQIPVNWQPDFQLNWYADQKIAWIRFVGVSTALARIKDAYVISTLTGHKEPLDVANTTNFNERWKIDHVEPIPTGAQVILVYEPKPSPSLPDFMSQWGAFEFHVVYDNKEYVKIYSQAYINSKMTREMPGFGPHVTPRSDK